MYYMVYELADGTTQVFGPFNSEELKHERASADRELHAREQWVVNYYTSYTKNVPARWDTEEAKA